MENFRDLFRDWRKIWFFIGEDRADREAFAAFAIKEGFSFGNGWEIKGSTIGNAMSLSADGQLLYLSLMAWSVSFRADANSIFENTDVNTVLRGKFRRFSSGDERWVFAGERELVSLAEYRKMMEKEE